MFLSSQHQNQLGTNVMSVTSVLGLTCSLCCLANPLEYLVLACGRWCLIGELCYLWAIPLCGKYRHTVSFDLYPILVFPIILSSQENIFYMRFIYIRVTTFTLGLRLFWTFPTSCLLSFGEVNENEFS